MIDVISLIVTVASSMVSVLTFTKQVTDDNKEKAARFLNEIALTIEDSINKIKNGEIPHGNCETMKQYADKVPDLLQGIIDTDILYEYSNKLRYAHDIERWLLSVRDDQHALLELEKAVGYFKAAAIIIELK